MPTATAMSVDNAFTDVTVTIRNAAGAVTTLVSRINYSLSRQGSTGASGPTGTPGTNLNPIVIYDFNGTTLPTNVSFPGTVAASDNNTTTTFTNNAFDQSIAVSSISLIPANSYLITMRVKVISGTWEGVLYYSNPNHGSSALYYKLIPAPTIGVWTDITVDMRELSVGTTDYINSSTITGLRFDFGNDSSFSIAVDHISVGKYGVAVPIFADLTSKIDSVSALSTGLGYTLPTGNALSLYSGGVKLTSGVTYAVTSAATINGLTLAINATTGAITLSGAAWTSTREQFTLTATYNSIVYTTTYSITKTVAGSNGTNGTSPLLYDIITSAPVLTKDATDAATTGAYSSITIQGKKYDGSTTTNYGWVTVTANGDTELTTATDTATTAVTLAPVSTAGKASYTIKMYNQAAVTGATLLDTQVIYAVYKGGLGVSGASALTTILSNESHVFPATNDGTVSTYANSGTDIRVYEGATELLYDGVGTSNSTWKVVTAATNITVGAIALVSGTSYARVQPHTAVANATDTSLITYTITGKTAAGTTFTITKTQSFSKSKAGSNGTSPLLYDIITSAPVLTKDAVDAATTGAYSSITIQGKKYDGSTTTNYGWVTVTANGDIESAAATDTATTPVTLAPVSTIAKSSYTIKMYNQATVSGATLLDTQVIYVVYKGASGTNGTNGTSTFVATIYKQVAADPTSPVATASSYNFANGVLTPPSGWVVIQPSTTTVNTWACEYTFTGTPGSTVTGVGNWSATRIDAVAGAPGAGGTSINTVELYQQSATAPTLPTGTSYDFSTDTVSAISPGTLGSWVRSIPASSTTPTYMTSCTFSVTAPTTTQTLATWSTAVVVARNGVSAPVVNITTGSQAFVTAKNTGTVSPTSIIATATTTNITTPTYAWYVDGAVQAGATTSTFTLASYSGASKVIKCVVTDGTISVFDQVTIYSLKEADDAISVTNSNENVTFTGPNSGYTGISFTNGSAVIQAYIGATALTYATTGANTFNCTNVSTSATVVTGTGTGTTFTVPAPTAMSAETAYTDVTVTVRNAAGTSATFITRITYSLSRLGSPGLNGVTQVTANLSNQTHIFPADINGNVTSYANSGTLIRVYEGVTELQYDATGTQASTWKITPTYTNITASAITDSGAYATVAAYSAGVAAATDSSSVVYTITGKTAANVAFTLTETQTFTKSKTGANGTSPLIYDIVTSAPVITKEAADAATTGTYSSITIQGKKYDGNTTTNYGWVTVTANGATEATTATDTATAAANLTPATTAGKSSYTIKMYNQAAVTGATLLDTQVVSVIFKGPTGNPGTNGASAISAIISNESHVFTAGNDGTVSVYTNSGTDIRVYEGATELAYDTVGTSNGSWKVVTTPTNITVGTITDSGTYATVGAHSGVAAGTDTSIIAYTITGTNSVGTTFSITKSQTFSKSKIGSQGVAGAKSFTARAFQWNSSATVPVLPTTTLTYTWATSSFAGTLDNGWATSVGAGTNGQKLYEISKVIVETTASATTTNFTFASATSNTISIRQDGSIGYTGPRVTDLYYFSNTASATAPTAPTAAEVTYDFSTGLANSTNTSWSSQFSPGNPTSADGATNKFWAVRVTFRESIDSVGVITQVTPVLSAPFTWQNFDGLVTFTNLADGKDADGIASTTLINGGGIKTGTIAADRISTTTLSAIQANLGYATVTNTGGYLKTDGRNYGGDSIASPGTTVEGFFLGYDGTAYKLDIGNAAKTKYLSYDGTDLTLTGGTINVGTTGKILGGQTDYNTGTDGFFLGYSVDDYKFSVGFPGNIVSVDIATSVFTSSTVIDYNTFLGSEIYFSDIGGITNIEINTRYYIAFYIGANTFKISKTFGGIAITLTGTNSNVTYASNNMLWNGTILKTTNAILNTPLLDIPKIYRANFTYRTGTSADKDYVKITDSSTYALISILRKTSQNSTPYYGMLYDDTGTGSYTPSMLIGADRGPSGYNRTERVDYIFRTNISLTSFPYYFEKGTRLLFTAQTDSTTNGIYYIVSQRTNLSYPVLARASDASVWSNFRSSNGTRMWVSGFINTGTDAGLTKPFVIATSVPTTGTLGTTAITFVPFVYTSTDTSYSDLMNVTSVGGYALYAIGTEITNSGVALVDGSRVAGQLLVTATSTGTLTTQHAARFYSKNAAGTTVSSAIVGGANGFAFYSELGGYGPFTGYHDCLINKNEIVEAGDILVDVKLIARKDISNTIFECKKSNIKNAKPIGVYLYREAMDVTDPPAAFIDDIVFETVKRDEFSEKADLTVKRVITKPELDTAVELYDLGSMNAVGEGQINVCGENGNLEPGDLIATSSIPGKGMKQDDDIVRSITVAKCREAVTFSSPTEVKLVSCIYLCG